jgi:hypothetical protein
MGFGEVNGAEDGPVRVIAGTSHSHPGAGVDELLPGRVVAPGGRGHPEVGDGAVVQADASGRVDDVADDGHDGVVHGAPQGCGAGWRDRLGTGLLTALSP